MNELIECQNKMKTIDHLTLFKLEKIKKSLLLKLFLIII
jgi:hypothetical protein